MPLTISYAETLIAAGKAAEAHELLLDLLNNVPPTAEQLRLIARAANAEGDVANAYFYMSYYYASIGNLPLAIGQVRMALETPNAMTSIARDSARASTSSSSICPKSNASSRPTRGPSNAPCPCRRGCGGA